MSEILKLGASGGRIDYAAAWFLKAAEYVEKYRARVGFVATNSITQGEQVAQIWTAIFQRYRVEIAFAHRTFAWGSDARGKAHVHVVIVGLAPRQHEPQIKRLFSYSNLNGDPEETTHSVLSPYLFDASQLSNRHLVVERVRTSLSGAPEICVGSKPVDGGHYILDDQERVELLRQEPDAYSLVRPYIGGREFINGESRWIIYPEGLPASSIRKMPAVMERITRVREFRKTSTGNLANELAETPTRFHVTVIPGAPFLAIPEVSSERREYVPIGWIEPPTIPSNQLLVILNANLDLFAFMTSRMHMAWMRYIGGRLKSDYRYSSGIVYNTFPWPVANETQKAKVSELAQAVLDARVKYPQSTLADLYDPDTMPRDLRKAHRDLDLAVDKLYRAKAFQGDRDRVEHLFGQYEKLVAPLTAVGKLAKKARARIAPGKKS